MSNRPERHDPAVAAAAFEKIWPAIKAWIGDSGGDDEDNRESAKKVLERSFGEDGYELAKDFDHAHFSANSDLVEILDEWGSFLYRAHQVEIRKWTKEYTIVPLFKVGDIVSFENGHRFKRDLLHDGVITKVDTDFQVYTINSQSAGHIEPNSGKTGITGAFANFEDLHKINPPKEAPNV